MNFAGPILEPLAMVDGVVGGWSSGWMEWWVDGVVGGWSGEWMERYIGGWSGE